MGYSYADYPRIVVEDIARVRRRLDSSQIPPRHTDYNLVIGTWNIKHFSQVFRGWDENPDSPKRNLRAMATIAEIVRRFDVIAIQEVKQNTEAIRMLINEFLGENWGVLLSDVTAGSAGNQERLAYIYDKRRVLPSGLAGELVLPPTPAGEPVEQFARTPYIAGFETAGQRFSLLTAHIKYGSTPEDRLPELRALARYVADEIRDRARVAGAEETNLIVLGDFNIDTREGNPLFEAFISSGLYVPAPLWHLKTTYGTEPKYYDQIAWFQGDLNLLNNDRAGVIDFTDAVYKELTAWEMSFRVSDHFPLWAAFIIDRSTETMARTLGVDPAMPNPLSVVPD